jgi:hypothetical protein
VPLALPTPVELEAVPAAELPAVLAQLAALQAAIAARLAAVPPPPPRVDSDGLLDAQAAAALLGRSESWLRKRGHTLPGYVQPTGRGGRVRWSRAALLAWRDGLASHTAARL